MSQVEWTTRARRDMRRLGPETADRVSRALYRFVETGYGDVQPVLGSKVDEKRLKVGKIRLFFVEKGEVLEVVGVLPRDKAYRTREVLVPFGSSAESAHASGVNA